MKGNTIDVLDLIIFYFDKNEHYPISDEFIEGYQQKNGGYITYAKKTGHIIYPKLKEPNQKWHLFESYCPYKLKDKKSTNFKIGTIKCPELLLWMAEAAGVASEYVKEASDYAKSKIDEIRNNSPEKSYSAAAVTYMNNKFKEQHNNQTLWDLIVLNINESKQKENIKNSI